MKNNKKALTNEKIEYILRQNKAKAIRFSTLEKICEALNCKPGDILDYEK